MSFYVYCVTLCLLVGKHSVSPYRKAPTVIEHSMTGMSENIGNHLARRCTNGVKIATGAVVGEGSVLRGDITIGQGTVVSPQAQIIADSGSIIIGQGNVIESMASIINRVPPGGSSDAGQTQIIGNGNVFKTRSTCEALKVGDGNVLQAGVYVGRQDVVTNGNVIG